MTVVFKFGGSLLTLPRLADKLQIVLDRYSEKDRLILTGGGASADLVRDWSQIHQLNDETAHWLAIASTDLNRQLLAPLLFLRSVSDRTEATRLWATESSPLLLDCSRFAREEEATSDETLPHNWDVTSDSLAAWTALRWPADELVLIKSVPMPDNMTAQMASDLALVDRYFPCIAKDLRKISWCNLRAENIVVEPWLSNCR
jgi:5-(aminomethyl)-3-furanmethanol phosphate kinase